MRLMILDSEIPVGVNLIMTRHSWYAELEPHRPHELLVKKLDVCHHITLNPKLPMSK